MKCMRPPEKWAKPSEPTTKRRGPYKRRKGKNGEGEPQSDCMTDSLQKTQGQTSPVREPDEPPNDQGVEQLPPRKRQRASSVEPRAQSSEDKTQWNGPAAAAAFRRAIQSSPPRLVGTAKTPIEIDAELTPKPTRRLLFPSPRRQGELKSLDDREKSKSSQAERVSPSKAKSHLAEVMYHNIMNDMNNDKENCPPPSQSSIEQDDEYAELFMDNAPDFQMISGNVTTNNTNNSTTTPSRSVTSLLFDPLKTPKSRNSASTMNSSARKKRAPLEVTSNGSTGKHAIARRHSIELSTPSRSAKRQQQQQLSGSAVTASMTPLTASLYQIFSSTSDDGDIVDTDMNMPANLTNLNPWTSPSQPLGFNADSNFDFPSATATNDTPRSRRITNILNMNMNMNMGLDLDPSDLNLHDENYSFTYNPRFNDNGDDEDLFYASGLSLTGAGTGIGDFDGGTAAAAAAAAAAASPSMAGLFSLYEDPVDDVAENGYDRGHGSDSGSGNANANGNDAKVLDVLPSSDQFRLDGVSDYHSAAAEGEGKERGDGRGGSAIAFATDGAGATDGAIAAGATIAGVNADAPVTTVIKEEQVEG